MHQPSTNRPDVKCAECGAPMAIHSPAAVLVTCEYCGSAVYWDAAGIASAAKQSRLTEGFTRLYRGAQGTLDGRRFEVLGRIRYRSEGAVWDEWFVHRDDGARAWITEDDHALALQSLVDSGHDTTRAAARGGNDPSAGGGYREASRRAAAGWASDEPDYGTIAGLSPGARFECQGRAFEVDEVGTAECVGVEGELPSQVLPGERYRFLDASSLDGALTLGIELDEQPPTVFVGHWLPHASVVLDDEGEDW